jgi:RNA polymerase sigma factor (sigma-70 family)
VTLTELFDAHHDSLFRYLVRLSGDRDLAADAAQEAFVRVIERPPPDGATRAWLYRVATNVVLETTRTRTRRERLALGGTARAPMADPPRDPLELVEADEERARVAAALEELSPKERTAVLMRQEGFSHREIADAVGTTTGSVGTLLARALDRLTNRLAAGNGWPGRTR